MRKIKNAILNNCLPINFNFLRKKSVIQTKERNFNLIVTESAAELATEEYDQFTAQEIEIFRNKSEFKEMFNEYY